MFDLTTILTSAGVAPPSRLACKSSTDTWSGVLVIRNSLSSVRHAAGASSWEGARHRQERIRFVYQMRKRWGKARSLRPGGDGQVYYKWLAHLLSTASYAPTPT